MKEPLNLALITFTNNIYPLKPSIQFSSRNIEENGRTGIKHKIENIPFSRLSEWSKNTMYEIETSEVTIETTESNLTSYFTHVNFYNRQLVF